MRHLLYILTLLLSYVVLGQNHLMVRAQESFEHHQFARALKDYQKLLVKHFNKENVYMVAECYRQMREFEKAREYYEILIKMNPVNAKAYLNHGLILENTGKYKKAISSLKRYKELNPEDEYVDALIQSCRMSIQEERSPQVSEAPIELINSEVNGPFNDFGPTSVNGKLLFASSRYLSKRARLSKWDNQPYLDLYIAGANGDIEMLSKIINTSKHEGPAFFDSIRSKLYFTRNIQVHNSRITNYGLSNLQLFEVSYDKGQWSHLNRFELHNSEFDIGHPALLPGGNTMYFVSNDTSGYGRSDIYVTHYRGGHWTRAFNLGPAINTSGMEAFPFLANDSTLYFASDGLVGHGGLDIFKATIVDDMVKKVENLKVPFNSPKDDFGLMFLDTKKDRGYLCSNRDGGKGHDDIYFFKPASKIRYIKFVSSNGKPLTDLALRFQIKAYDASTDQNGVVPLYNNVEVDELIQLDTGKYVKASFKVYGLNLDTTVITLAETHRHDGSRKLIIRDITTNKEIAKVPVEINNHAQEQSIYYSDSLGEVLIPSIVSGELEVKINFRGYYVVYTKVSMNEEEKTIYLQPMLERANYGLQTIYYDYNKYHLTQTAKMKLDSAIRIMQMKPEAKIELSAHADERGTELYNMDLSSKRANSVLRYLYLNEVAVDRIYIRYFGEYKLAKKCPPGAECNDLVHKWNRRTEFRLLESD